MNKDCAWCSNTINPNDYWYLAALGDGLRFHAQHCLEDYLAMRAKERGEA